MISKEQILKAYSRIGAYIVKTPLISSSRLNELLGHEIVFKLECLQVTGSFKVRGVLNALLTLKEQKIDLEKIVAYSSGNHAKALAWAAKEIVNIPAQIFMHKSASKTKQEVIKKLGAELIVTNKRIEAEEGAKAIGSLSGNYFLHPSDNDLVICGAATLAFEALNQEEGDFDAIFASCGGGALLSGVYLGSNAADSSALIYGCEPEIANDASRSYQLKNRVGFDESPMTIADGLRTLKVSERAFEYLLKLNGFIEVSEDEINYWFVWLNKLLETQVEPTSAVAMAGSFKWLKQQTEKKKILVILSGGNIDEDLFDLLNYSKYLDIIPKF